MQAFYLGGGTKMRSAAMYPLDIIQEQEKRLQSLEHELIEASGRGLQPFTTTSSRLKPRLTKKA